MRENLVDDLQVIADKICNDICRYSERIDIESISDEELESFMEAHCVDCIVMRLI